MADQNNSYDTISFGGKNYPPLLCEIPKPPQTIYALGDFRDWSKPAVAIVGTRKATRYGLETARLLAREAAAAGAVVISGLAIGIDAEAHRGALEAGGKTVAVLGSGINMIYPALNRPLARQIVEQHGAILSEFPPDMPPEKWTFPQRNRIVAGLAKATVVVEAPEKSGALITAYLALEFNREVGAVPGDINSPNSEGAHKLLKLGAAIIRNANDLLEILGLAQEQPGAKLDNIDEMENLILQYLNEPRSPDEIMQLSELPSDMLNQKLSSLELKSIIKNRGGLYERCSATDL